MPVNSGVRFHMKSLCTLTTADCEEVLRINTESLQGYLSFVEVASEPFIYIDQVAVDAGSRRGSLASTQQAF